LCSLLVGFAPGWGHVNGFLPTNLPPYSLFSFTPFSFGRTGTLRLQKLNGGACVRVIVPISPHWGGPGKQRILALKRVAKSKLSAIKPVCTTQETTKNTTNLCKQCPHADHSGKGGPRAPLSMGLGLPQGPFQRISRGKATPTRVLKKKSKQGGGEKPKTDQIQKTKVPTKKKFCNGGGKEKKRTNKVPWAFPNPPTNTSGWE